MTLSTKLHIAAYSLIIIAAGVFLRGWVDDHILRAKAEAVAEAQKTVIDAADKRIADRDSTHREEIKGLQDAIAKVQTPAQAIRYIHDSVPLPQPVTQARDLPSTLPSAPVPQGMRTVTVHDDDAIVPVADFRDIAQKVNKCQQAGADLTQCAADKIDMQQKIDAANLEAHTWKVAAKGGTKREKFLKALKVIGCSAAGGAVGSLAAGSNASAQNRLLFAGVGAGAAATACTLF